MCRFLIYFALSLSDGYSYVPFTVILFRCRIPQRARGQYMLLTEVRHDLRDRQMSDSLPQKVIAFGTIYLGALGWVGLSVVFCLIFLFYSFFALNFFVFPCKRMNNPRHFSFLWRSPTTIYLEKKIEM